MKFVFLAQLYKKEDEDELLHLSNGAAGSSSDIFPWSIIEGLEQQNNTVVDIINTLPVGTYPCNYKKLFLRTKKWQHSVSSSNLEIGCINLPVIRFIIKINKIIRYLKNRVKNDTIDAIIVYFPHLLFLLAANYLPDNLKIILIVPDLPEFSDLSAEKSKLRNLFMAVYNNAIISKLARVDGFVLLTEQMKNLLPINGKPYTVVEGITPNINHHIEYHEDKSEKIILYTGTLNYAFGIGNLLRAFKEIQEPDYRLWICGTGEAANDITAMCKSDKRLTFFGPVGKTRVHELQSKATVLINPRTNEDEYTKYSFPSKTTEYMVSGKPVIMYKLDGVPDEYDEYLYYVKDNSISSLRDKIIEICSISPKELHKFGTRAREWILSEKNGMVQAKKIIDLVDSVNKV